MAKQQKSLALAQLPHSVYRNFTTSDQASILYNEFENCTLKITATSPRASELKLIETEWRIYESIN